MKVGKNYAKEVKVEELPKYVREITDIKGNEKVYNQCLKILASKSEVAKNSLKKLDSWVSSSQRFTIFRSSSNYDKIFGKIENYSTELYDSLIVIGNQVNTVYNVYGQRSSLVKLDKVNKYAEEKKKMEAKFSKLVSKIYDKGKKGTNGRVLKANLGQKIDRLRSYEIKNNDEDFNKHTKTVSNIIIDAAKKIVWCEKQLKNKNKNVLNDRIVKETMQRIKDTKSFLSSIIQICDNAELEQKNKKKKAIFEKTKSDTTKARSVLERVNADGAMKTAKYSHENVDKIRMIKSHLHDMVDDSELFFENLERLDLSVEDKIRMHNEIMSALHEHNKEINALLKELFNNFDPHNAKITSIQQGLLSAEIGINNFEKNKYVVELKKLISNLNKSKAEKVRDFIILHSKEILMAVGAIVAIAV